MARPPKSVRTVDLDPTTLEVLATWQQTQREIHDHDLAGLFTKADGTLLNPQTVSQAFDRVVARTGLPKLTLHGLRHTHVTLLLKAGVSLNVVSERLGHSTPAFTMTTYQHVLPGMQAEAAATFADLLDHTA